MHVVVIGNPADGIYIVGPFEERQDACDYIAAEFSKADMWVMELTPPASDEGEPV